MTTFKTLEELQLGLSASAVRQAFAPFIAADASNWVSATRDRRLRTVSKAVRRGLAAVGGRGARNLEAVSSEYEDVWAAGYARYDLARGGAKPVPWLFRGEKLMADMGGAARFRNLILARAIAGLKPRTVLEVGCGNGINLLLLAGAFADVSFTGLELTESGWMAARNLQKGEALPAHLSGYAIAEQKDARAFKRIDFQRGNAMRMPFADGQFDLVYTILSIEQMERIRAAALREVARVTGKHLLNMEPFAEANSEAWRKFYVWSRDYFRGRIADMPQYGLEPLWATIDFPQETVLGAALVLSRKTAAA